MEHNLIVGQLLALLTAACWAQNALIYRHLGQRVGSDAVAHIRMWIAFPAIILLTYLMEGIWFPVGLSAKTYLFLLASGAIGFFITDLLLFKAYVLLGARESMVIMTLSPVVTALFGFLIFHERLNFIQILGIFVTILGVTLMVLLDGRRKQGGSLSDEERSKLKGLIYAILGSVLQSLSFLFARFALEETGAVSTNLLRNLGGLGAFIIFNVFYKRDARSHFQTFRNPRLFFLLFIAALTGPVVSMSLQMKAFTLAPVGIVTTITQVTPILLLPFDRFILHKKITPASLGATFLSILGVAILFLAA